MYDFMNIISFMLCTMQYHPTELMVLNLMCCYVSSSIDLFSL